MARYLITLPTAPSDPDRVDAWLAAHGYAIEDGSAVLADGRVAVHVDRDPSADAASYDDAPALAEQAAINAVARLRKYNSDTRAIAPASRTREQQALLDILTVLRLLLIP